MIHCLKKQTSNLTPSPRSHQRGVDFSPHKMSTGLTVRSQPRLLLSSWEQQACETQKTLFCSWLFQPPSPICSSDPGAVWGDSVYGCPICGRALPRHFFPCAFSYGLSQAHRVLCLSCFTSYPIYCGFHFVSCAFHCKDLCDYKITSVSLRQYRLLPLYLSCSLSLLKAEAKGRDCDLSAGPLSMCEVS